MENWIRVSNTFIRPSAIVQIDLIHNKPYDDPIRFAITLTDGSKIELPYERYAEVTQKLNA